MLTIRAERPADRAAIERLLDQAFGVDRHEKTAQRLRDGRLPANGLAFVAHSAGELVGTISLWDVTAGEAARPALLLGPVAVTGHLRGQGIGRKLVRHGLNQAAALGHAAVILVGDAPYYGGFGFTRALTEGLVLPGPVETERFLGLELKPGALSLTRGPVTASGRVAVHPMPLANIEVRLAHAPEMLR
jgi:predicted N-acetyltransferase YhbS